MLMEHYVLNAVLFMLTGIRYFWGSPNDMLRLGLFLICGWVVVGDMDFYYQWPLQLPTFGVGPRETITKLMLIATLLIDIGRDYIRVRFRRRLLDIKEWVRPEE